MLYCSRHGHIATLAAAIAEGARSVPGTEVVIKRVPELTLDEETERHGSPSAVPTASVVPVGAFHGMTLQK